MTRSNDGFEVFFVVVVLAVSEFDGSNLPRLRVESEVVVEAPPIITQSLFDLETRGDFVVVARHVGYPDARQEVGFTVGIVSLWEQPRKLEACLDDDDRFVPLLEADGGVKVGDSDVG